MKTNLDNTGIIQQPPLSNTLQNDDSGVNWHITNTTENYVAAGQYVFTEAGEFTFASENLPIGRVVKGSAAGEELVVKLFGRAIQQGICEVDIAIGDFISSATTLNDKNEVVIDSTSTAAAWVVGIALEEAVEGQPLRYLEFHTPIVLA
jgi:hypothetical protein